MATKELRIAIIGCNFMGKAHSNAWRQASRFFPLPLQPVLQVACARHEAAARAFADTWGWRHVETDWRKVLERDDVDDEAIHAIIQRHHRITQMCKEQ